MEVFQAIFVTLVDFCVVLLFSTYFHVVGSEGTIGIALQDSDAPCLSHWNTTLLLGKISSHSSWCDTCGCVEIVFVEK